MSKPDSNEPLFLCDKNGHVYAVQISRELWEKIEPAIQQHLKPAEPEEPALKPEPLADWETLGEYWDFKYPVNFGVRCDICDESTDNWLKDEPRKFWLLTANLGGLVSYRCLKCQARVSKKFFKDKITFEAKPYQDQQDSRLNAKY